MKPTPEQLQKLPKWAQEHIVTIERQRDNALRHIEQFNDSQTPSPFYVDEWSSKPRIKRYINNPQNRICVDHLGMHLEVFLPFEGDGQRLPGIELSYRRVDSIDTGLALVPRGNGVIALVTPESLC